MYIPRPSIVAFVVLDIIFGKVVFGEVSIAKLPEGKFENFRKIAEQISKSINTDLDPCDDYVEYACSNFDIYNTTFKRFIDESDFKSIIRKYLENEDYKLDAELKMLNFFRACEVRSGQLDVGQLLKFSDFPQSTKGWPALNPDWNESSIDISATVAELRTIGVEVLINFTLKENSGKRYLFLTPKHLNSFSYSQTSGDIESELTWRKEILHDFNIENAEEVINDFIQIEKKYSAILSSLPNKTLQVRGNYLLLKSMIPQFDWDQYFRLVLERNLYDSYPIRLEYLDELQQLIEIFKAAHPKVWVNYIFVRFLEKLHEDFMCKFSCSCSEKTMLFFQPVISRIVKDNFFTEQLRKHFLNIISDFVRVQEYSRYVYDSKTSDEVMDEIETIWNNEYFERLLNESVNREYKNLNITSDNYYSNLIQLYRYFSRRHLNSYFAETSEEAQHINEDEVQMHLTNAIYHSHDKPLAIIFDMIGMPIVVKAIRTGRSSYRYNDSIEDCLRAQLNISTQLESFHMAGVEGTELYIKTYNRWANKNWDLIEAEDEVFREFGLTNKKIIFISYIQAVCPFVGKDPHLRRSLLANLWNLEEFSEEYNCTQGSLMNPEVKCLF